MECTLDVKITGFLQFFVPIIMVHFSGLANTQTDFFIYLQAFLGFGSPVNGRMNRLGRRRRRRMKTSTTEKTIELMIVGWVPFVCIGSGSGSIYIYNPNPKKENELVFSFTYTINLLSLSYELPFANCILSTKPKYSRFKSDRF